MSRYNAWLPASPRWGIIFVGLLLYVVCLLITAPASLLAWCVAYASDNVAYLEHPNGGVWRGGASTLVISAPGADPQKFSNVTWMLAGGGLVRGQLVFKFNLDDKNTRGSSTLILEHHALRLVDSNVTLPASTIATFFPALKLARVRGEVTARAKDLLVQQNSWIGAMEIDWVNASTTLGPVDPLGTYRANAKSKDGHVQIDIITLKGALQVMGSGTWSIANGLNFNGVARAEPAETANLRNLLLLLGRDDGNGNYQMKFAARP